MSDQRTDEARWRDAGKPQTMTLEQRAEYIACARSIRGVIGGTIHNKIRDRALEQLREVDALARQGDEAPSAMRCYGAPECPHPTQCRRSFAKCPFEDGASR